MKIVPDLGGMDYYPYPHPKWKAFMKNSFAFVVGNILGAYTFLRALQEYQWILSKMKQ